MSRGLTESPDPFVLAEWPEQGRDEIVEDFTDLLETLTERDQDPLIVEQNLDRVIHSPISHLVVIAQGSQIISTATLNALPILTATGRRLWIDDVATLPTYQGQGHSKRIMDTLECISADLSDEVYLTSSAHRGPARRAYEKRGYQLLNEADEPQVVFRNTTVGKIEGEPTAPAETLSTNFTSCDVDELAAILDEDPATLEGNLDIAVRSATTRVFVSRGTGAAITGVAVANQTPIPVGKKPWIDNIDGLYPQDVRAVVAAAGSWLGKSYKHVNIVAPPTADFGEGYKIRDSGLYVKHLGDLAAQGA